MHQRAMLDSIVGRALDPGLYIVATPIGNLGDLTIRAAEVLRTCDLVACEDTRVTGRLLHHLGIEARMIRYDDHADDARRAQLLAAMAQGAVALVSDAGTPLISDSGFRLVREARAEGIAIRTVPGPCAVPAALVLSGLPTDRFLFAGFLPAKDKARRDVLAELAAIRATLIFYETAPRLAAALEAVEAVLPGREIAVARELTKSFEECRTGDAATLIAHYKAHPPKGEIVLMIGPPGEAALDAELDIDALLRAELETRKPSQAVSRLAKEYNLDRKALYARALALREE